MKKYATILRMAMILPLLIGAGCSSSTPLAPSALKSTSASPSVLNPAPAAVQTMPAYCTDAPTANEGIGGNIWPIAPEYANLPFGDVFTAATCGADRMKQVLGDDNGKFIDGSRVQLKSVPDASFQATLKDIGFTCVESKVTDACKDWRLDESVKVEQILRLKPYLHLIEREECVNCG